MAKKTAAEQTADKIFQFTAGKSRRRFNALQQGVIFAIIGAVIGYALLPIDLIPDFILGGGFIDEIAAALVGISAIRILAGRWLRARRRTKRR